MGKPESHASITMTSKPSNRSITSSVSIQVTFTVYRFMEFARMERESVDGQRMAFSKAMVRAKQSTAFSKAMERNSAD